MKSSVKRRLAEILCLVSVAALAACAPPSVKTDLLMPAKQSGMTGAKRIGVLPLKGDQGERFTARLQAFIANINVKNAPYFTLVNIDRDAVMRELKLSDSAQFDEASALRLGKLVAADTFFSGSVTPPQVKTTKRLEQRSECVAKVTDKNDPKYGSCKEVKKKQVLCFTQNAAFKLTLRSSRVETGTVNFIKDYQGRAKHGYCLDRGGQRSKEELGEVAIAQVLAELRQDIAPYPVTVSIDFLDFDEKSGLGSKKFRFDGRKDVSQRFKAAMKNVKAGNTDAGCAGFRDAASLFNSSPAIYHNIGVCAEIGADYDQAETFYRRAKTLSGGSISVIDASLARLAETRRNAVKLADQLNGK